MRKTYEMLLLMVVVLVIAVFGFFLTGCELRENAVIREQTETFTGEIRDKNKEMQSIANQLKVANEKNKKLEQMLLCRDELTDDAVETAKRDMLKTIPVLDIKTPQKSNKVQKEREENAN
tara:strand:- start:1044 stop:1403 length:360 start_codon:yes stop_codon:yes gene_type:complete